MTQQQKTCALMAGGWQQDISTSLTSSSSPNITMAPVETPTERKPRQRATILPEALGRWAEQGSEAKDAAMKIVDS